MTDPSQPKSASVNTSSGPFGLPPTGTARNLQQRPTKVASVTNSSVAAQNLLSGGTFNVHALQAAISTLGAGPTGAGLTAKVVATLPDASTVTFYFAWNLAVGGAATEAGPLQTAVLGGLTVTQVQVTFSALVGTTTSTYSVYALYV